jgi:hypothetical protein
MNVINESERERVEDIAAHNDMISRANARLDELKGAGVKASARLCVHGVEIEIIEPAFGGKCTRSYQIITPRTR